MERGTWQTGAMANEKEVTQASLGDRRGSVAAAVIPGAASVSFSGLEDGRKKKQGKLRNCTCSVIDIRAKQH
jgi:hypothetical protein